MNYENKIGKSCQKSYINKKPFESKASSLFLFALSSAMDLIAIVDGENFSNNGDGKNRYPHSPH